MYTTARARVKESEAGFACDGNRLQKLQ